MAIVGVRVRRINRVCFQSLFTMSLNVTTTDRGENRDCLSLKALKDYANALSSHFKGKMHQLKQEYCSTFNIYVIACYNKIRFKFNLYPFIIIIKIKL